MWMTVSIGIVPVLDHACSVCIIHCSTYANVSSQTCDVSITIWLKYGTSLILNSAQHANCRLAAWLSFLTASLVTWAAQDMERGTWQSGSPLLLPSEIRSWSCHSPSLPHSQIFSQEARQAIVDERSKQPEVQWLLIVMWHFCTICCCRFSFKLKQLPFFQNTTNQAIQRFTVVFLFCPALIH